MIGLGTNVLPRYLVQDDPVQSPRATEIIPRRLTEEEPGFVSLVTILEVVWVLKSLYKRSREEIANDIRSRFKTSKRFTARLWLSGMVPGPSKMH